MITITGYALLVLGPVLLALAAALVGLTFFARQRFRVPLSVTLLVLNLVGSCLYLSISRGISSGGESTDLPVGEAASWFLYAVPVFASYVIADLVVFGVTVFRSLKKKEWELSPFATLVPVVWMVAFYIESAK